MTELQNLANYLAGVFNLYKRKSDSDTDIIKIKNVLDTVFPEKSAELQTAFETEFPDLFPSA